MSKLNIKPIEAGISVAFAISDGLIFNESELSINLKEYKNEIDKIISRSNCFGNDLFVYHKGNNWAIDTKGP